MYCRKCEARISDSAKFCIKCGTAVVQNKMQSVEVNTQTGTQVQVNVPQEVQENVSDNAQQEVSTSIQTNIQADMPARETNVPIQKPAIPRANQTEDIDASKKKLIVSGPLFLIAIILIYIKPVIAIGFVLLAGIITNYIVGHMLLLYCPNSKNQVFWIQLIYNLIEIITIVISLYYLCSVITSNIITYLSDMVPFNMLSLFGVK